MFHLTLTEAAEHLGIKKSALANVCERLLPGIRWPQRKLASLEVLKTSTEADHRLSEGERQVCGWWGRVCVGGGPKAEQGRAPGVWSEVGWAGRGGAGR